MRRGLTLVELLVAIALTSIIAIVIFQFVSSENTNYVVTRQKIRLQSDAREGMRILEQELTNAGFRTGNSVVDGVLSPTLCADVLYTTGLAAGSALDPVPLASTEGVAIYGSGNQGVEFLLYTPRASGSFSCGAERWRVGYRWEPNGALSRQAVQGTSAFTAGGWVPFLNNVKDLQWKFGLLKQRASLLNPADLNTAWYVNNATVALSSTTPTTVNVRANEGGDVLVVFSGKPILPAGIGSTEVQRATYRFSFDVAVTNNFLDEATGLGAGTHVTAGLFTAGGQATDTRFTFRPLAGASRNISYDLTVAPQPSMNTTPLYFGLRLQMKATSPGGADRIMGLSNLTVLRLKSGDYVWKTAEDLVAGDAAQIQAVRVQANVTSKKETLRFDRVIPVVNNGTP